MSQLFPGLTETLSLHWSLSSCDSRELGDELQLSVRSIGSPQGETEASKEMELGKGSHQVTELVQLGSVER